MAVEPCYVEEPWPFRTCPHCDSTAFTAFSEEATVIFTCLGCGSRWKYLLGYLQELGDQPPRLVSPRSSRDDVLTS